MRNSVFMPLLALAIAPSLSFAHAGDADFSQAGTVPEMMRYMEDSVLGEELHEEMEGLMVKMMDGTMNETEARRMAELMQSYPGPYGMMMSRLGWSGGGGMMRGGDFGRGGMPWTNMMNFGGGFWGGAMSLASIVWLIVGILAAVWLWQQITKK